MQRAQNNRKERKELILRTLREHFSVNFSEIRIELLDVMLIYSDK